MRMTNPWTLVAILACTVPAETPAREDAPASQANWSFDLVDEAGRSLPTFLHRGRTYVMGAVGQRYRVRVRNGAGRRVEVVVSVDGRDVIDGGPSSLEKHGYVVDAHGEVVIDGFRLSESAVAAFRFGPVSRSYAALEGDARDVGVIGVAVFPESRPWPVPLREAPAPAGVDAESRSDSTTRSKEALGSARPARRPGLGTMFGEERGSRVRHVSFERESTRPAVVLALRYDDRPGLLSAGVDVDEGFRQGDARLRRTADPFRRDARFAPPPRGWSPAG